MLAQDVLTSLISVYFYVYAVSNHEVALASNVSDK